MTPQYQAAHIDDSEPVSLAHKAVRSLTPCGSLCEVRLPRLQEFLWRELPVQWTGELELHLAVAAALGEQFAAAGMTDHAALCTSTRTEKIIWTYGTTGQDAGLAAYRAALGETPPPAHA